MSRTLTVLSSCLLSLGSLLLLAGCRVEPFTRGELHVVGGATPAPDSPARRSLVALARKTNDRYDTFCSGTLVAPRLVLTAAHCLAGQSNPERLHVLFDLGVLGETLAVRRVEASKTFQPDPARYYPNFDIAWIRLDAPAPEGFEPAEILRDPELLSPLLEVPDALILAGYGKVSSNCSVLDANCAGQARETRTLLRRVVDTPHFRDLLLIGPKPGSGSCSGDSGGPVYAQVEGRWYVLGALHGKSTLLNSRAVLDSERICESGESVYTFAGAYIDWIERTSGIRLASIPAENPSGRPDALRQRLPLQPTLLDYLLYDAPTEEVWYTMHALLSGFQDPDKRIDPGLDLLVTDPRRAAAAMAEWTEFSSQGVVYSLTALTGRDEQISDLRPFVLLKNLRKLELVGHRIRDTQALGRLAQLEELTLSNNFDFRTRVKIPWDLGFLKNLPLLRTLNLVTNGESLDLKAVPWESLQALETLILSNNAGSLDLTAIPWRQLPQLKHLVIMNSELKDISPLAEARGLEQLNLGRNQIRDISALQTLDKLRVVDLSQNQIEDFTVVEQLEHLERLVAVGNPTDAAICPPGASCVYSPGDAIWVNETWPGWRQLPTLPRFGAQSAAFDPEL